MERVGTPLLYSEALSPAHEAAVLFSAGHRDAAIAGLAATLDRGDRQAHLVLLELYRQAGRTGDFQQLSERLVRAFPGCHPPPWQLPAPLDVPGTARLEGVLQARSAELARLLTHGVRRVTFAIDMGSLERIEFAALGELTALLRNLQLAGKRVILANVGELTAALLEAAGAQQFAVVMRRKVNAESGWATGPAAPAAPRAAHLAATA